MDQRRAQSDTFQRWRARARQSGRGAAPRAGAVVAARVRGIRGGRTEGAGGVAGEHGACV